MKSHSLPFSNSHLRFSKYVYIIQLNLSSTKRNKLTYPSLPIETAHTLPFFFSNSHFNIHLHHSSYHIFHIMSIFHHFSLSLQMFLHQILHLIVNIPVYASIHNYLSLIFFIFSINFCQIHGHFHFYLSLWKIKRQFFTV